MHQVAVVLRNNLWTVHQLVCLSVHLSIDRSIHPSIIYLSAPSIYPSACQLSIDRSIHPSIHPSIYLCIYLSVELSIQPSIYSARRPASHTAINPSIHCWSSVPFVLREQVKFIEATSNHIHEGIEHSNVEVQPSTAPRIATTSPLLTIYALHLPGRCSQHAPECFMRKRMASSTEDNQ
jgi:hypothetical protein